MRTAFYEDSAATNFTPIALTRPVFELLCGQFTLRERVLRFLDVSDWGVFLRPHLSDVYHEAHPEARINDSIRLRDAPTLLINGRWVPDEDALKNIDPTEAGLLGETLVYLTLDPLEAPLLEEGDDWHDALARIAGTRKLRQVTGIVAEYPWDLVNRNGEQLGIDFHLRKYQEHPYELEPQVAVIGPREEIHVDEAAVIDPFVVLDSRNGPISVDAGAKIQSFTRLEGPCHVGRNSQLFGANVRGATTIGADCRVGGEVEASLLHGYVNKYHDGFLGHSYVCPWVNLGALTTNSDLKNDYSEIRVPLEGASIDTGLTKVGCFIGDYTKTALGSLINTGSAIGVMCMILPGGELLPKHIPSYSSIWHGELTEGFALERNLQTARKAMARRNCELTSAQERLLERLFEATRTEREDAIFRHQEKQRNRQSVEQTGRVVT